MFPHKPIVVTISGFDPSLGAGITADIIAIRAAGCIPLGIITGFTIQNNVEVSAVCWNSIQLITDSITKLEKYKVVCVKIGIIQNEQMLYNVCCTIKNIWKAKIIWDPVFSASSGFQFWQGLLPNLIGLPIDFITPNLDEAKILFNSTDPVKISEFIKEKDLALSVVLKSGHSKTAALTDFIISKYEVSFMSIKRLKGSAHGTGCVFSSTFSAELAKEMRIKKGIKASQNAVKQHIKQYKNEFAA